MTFVMFRGLPVAGMALCLGACAGAGLPSLDAPQGSVVAQGAAASTDKNAEPSQTLNQPSAAGAVTGAAAGSAPASDIASSKSARGDGATGYGEIGGYRQGLITIYSSEDGQDGQRVPSATLTKPLKIINKTADGKRLQIMTVDGARWLLAADVVVASAR